MPSDVLLPSDPRLPEQILNNDQVVSAWTVSPGFQAFWSWIQRRCDRIKGKEIMTGPYEGESVAIRHLLHILDSLVEWVSEVPPLPGTSQRFGNMAFRTYCKLIEERLPALLTSIPLPDHLAAQILPLLIQSHAFGHPTRLDYGTGHELAFILTLWCCVVSGWVGAGWEDEEDELILRVFVRYTDLTTLLQMTYRLEPAGSHGVWGLDDYCFFPYLFGSAQLLDSALTPPKSLALAVSLKPTLPKPPIPPSSKNPDPSDPTFLNTSQDSSSTSSSPPQTIPTPSSITDLYTLSLHRLTYFKSGAPFSEHSPLLHSLSQMPNWNKPHSGLRKMFLGEVVGKRVVVQGLWIGGWCWGEDIPGSGKEARRDGSSDGPTRGGRSEMGGTGAPWATTRRVDGRREILDSTRSSWTTPTPRR